MASVPYFMRNDVRLYWYNGCQFCSTHTRQILKRHRANSFSVMTIARKYLFEGLDSLMTFLMLF